ncbi:MAG: hypothetical protein H7A20_05890 [Rhodanobacteraceae bacterium]|nr:hypothetical protein [Rhodanobacteraceae bacterium]HRY01408.1 hypothetical protein [Xanthomonadaceae bacterium]
MFDFKLGQVLGLLLRTTPYLFLRLMVYVGISLAYLIVTGAGAGIGWIVGKAASNPGFAFWGGAIGFGLTSGVLYWLREYLLYMVKAGHIAVLAELLEGKEIPGGKGQLAHGAEVVKSRFVESSVLFGVDRLINGIIRVINRMTMRIANWLPIPGLDSAMGIINAILRTSLTYVDEVILAHNIRVKSDNAWATSRDAVVLYAQNYKTLLKNAAAITVIVWLLTALIFVVCLAPALGVASLFPNVASFWGVAIAVVLAWGLKAALVDPLAMTALMQVYFKVSAGQMPNAEWSGKLEGWSGKFRQLKEKAGGIAPQPAPALPGSAPAAPPPPPPAG